MTSLLLIAVDLVAVVVLAYAFYFRRHRRRDLVTAFVVVNIGVLAVTKVLASAEIGMGVGLGLFGVLSIIRLRSSEISQHEVAYYFASLAIGLIAGFDTLQPVLSISLIGLILAMIAIVDSPMLLSRSRQQSLRLERAFTDESSLRAHVERLRRFVADASHELRTPLAAVSGCAELAGRGQEPLPGTRPWRQLF